MTQMALERLVSSLNFLVLFITTVLILGLLVAGYFWILLQRCAPSGSIYVFLHLLDGGCRVFWCRRHVLIFLFLILGGVFLLVK